MPGGFKESPLHLNAGWGGRGLEQDAILSRADRLAQRAQRCGASELPTDLLDAYRPRAATGGYTIKDHPYLLSDS
jgi:hypothetical protein